ncbi:armadillo-type protein [Fennellomyces sp. T-0311]|nr:armadillo-type protein [Fennellomyces sp. T-0311]
MQELNDTPETFLAEGTKKRFKFQSFNTLVDRIKVDVVRRSRLVDEDPDEFDSFFYQALLSWKDLNMTKHFTTFQREMTPLAKTLPSIIYHKDQIVNVLEKHLQVQDSMALDALLDLVTKLAKDLEGEFYPYFPRLFAAMLPIVYSRDFRILECLFNAIAYLFKYLARQILPDLCSTFSLISRLLGEDHKQKPYIRHFTAEAFAFLLRKTRGKDFAKITQHILASLRENPSEQYIEGLAMLFFECMKQVDHQLHSRASNMFKELQSQILDEKLTMDDLESNAFYGLLMKTTILVLNHTNAPHLGPFVDVILTEVDTELKRKTLDEKRLCMLVSLLKLVVTVRRGSRVQEYAPIVQRTQNVAKQLFATNSKHSEYLYTETLGVISGILALGSLESVLSGGRVILESVVAFNNPSLVYGFFLSLSQLEWDDFAQVMLPYIVKYTAHKFDEFPEQTILLLAELISSGALQLPEGTLSSSVTPEGLLRLPGVKGRSVTDGLLEMLHQSYDWDKERDILNEIDVNNHELEATSIITSLQAAVYVLPRIQVDLGSALEAILALIDSITNHLALVPEGNNPINTPLVLAHENFVLEALVGQGIESLAKLATANQAAEKTIHLHDKLVDYMLENHGHNEMVLRGVFLYMDMLRSDTKYSDKFSFERLGKIYALLKENLSSFQTNCRLYTAKIIGLFDQPMMEKDKQHMEDEDCDLAQVAIDLEESAMSLVDFRDKIMYTQKLGVIQGSGRVPEIYSDFVLRYGLGILNIQLRPLWAEVKKVLATCADTDRELYWSLCFRELSKFDDQKELIRDGFTSDTLLAVHAGPQVKSRKATKTGNISFECHTLNKFQSVGDRAMALMGDEKANGYAILFVKLSGQENARMDYWHYYSLILQTLKGTPGVTEQRARHLTPTFFKFIEREYNSVVNDDEHFVEEDQPSKDAMQIDTDEEEFKFLRRSRGTVKAKLISWLEMFAVFTNPKVTYKSQELYTILMRLLSKGEIALQKAALEVVFTWKNRSVTPYVDNLRNLLNDTRFRDEMFTFLSQEEEQALIDPAHRQELMPIVMRILYGRLSQPAPRRTKSSTRVNKESRRNAILSAVAICQPSEVECFLDLALASFKSVLELPDGIMDEKTGALTEFTLDERGNHLLDNVPMTRQAGFLSMLEGLLFAMRTKVEPYLPTLLKLVLYIGKFTQHRKNADDDDDNDKEQDQPAHEATARSKDVHTAAVKRMVEAFKLNVSFDFAPYLPVIFAAFISPRLPALPSQAPSGKLAIMAMFKTWTERRERISYFVEYDKQLLPQLFGILGSPNIMESVLKDVLDIIDTLLDYCDAEMEDNDVSLKDQLFVPHVDILLDKLHFRLTKSKDESQFGSGVYSVRQIAIVSRIAPLATSGQQATTIVELLLPNLKKSSRIIPEKTKEHILSVWAKFIHLIPGFKELGMVYSQYYSTASQLFSSLRSRECRSALLSVFHAFVEVNPSLTKVDELLTAMNTYSKKRLDEPDYDGILDAMNTVADDLYSTFDHQQWQPLLHQFVHNMHDPEEMAVRGAATHCMTVYLKAADEQQDQEEKRQLLNYVTHMIFPAIKRGVTNHIELIRLEFVNLLNAAVKTFPTLPVFEDMVSLLGDGNEEVNFFNNIYHMQLHRRVRALQRLGETAESGALKPASINSVFIPLVTAFFYETDRVKDHNLINQCTTTITALTSQLGWSRYYGMFRSYMELIAKKPEMEKVYLKIVSSILDAFHFDLKNVEVSDEQAIRVMGRQKTKIEFMSSEEMTKAAESKEEEDKEEEEEEESPKDLAAKIHDTVINRMLPSLNTYLTKTATKESVLIRIPIALGVAKLLRALPERSMRTNLPGLLVSLCQMIRSRALDVREALRDTLLKVNAYLGPSYLSFIIKELKTALTKGYEVHVLGYTVNVLLADTIPRIEVGQIDYCLEDIVDILINDVFGKTGQEKEADEMTGKIKEARSQKSMGTFETLSKVIHFHSVSVLLMPLKDVMSETQSLKILRKVDDILKRVSAGLVRNPEYESLELLEFSHGLISENLDTYKAKAKVKIEKSQQDKNFEVQLKRPDNTPTDHLQTNAFRFVDFGLTLLLTGLRRNKFDPKVEEHAEKLNPLVPLISNTLHSTHTSSIIIATKIMRLLITYPLPEVPNAVPAVMKRAFKLIKSSGNTRSQLIQSCFKMITVCIRDTQQAKLTEHQLVYLLNIIRPDLEEPDRQGTVFALIRAIIARKFMAPEVYDLMDLVGQVMVTNQAKEIRDQARSVYFLFLMDYPQGKERLKTQMSFMVRNLEYIHESGRESIMELLHQVINKFGDAILMEYAESIFLGLVLRLVNDESAKCREMAGELIKLLLGRCTDDKLSTVYRLLDKWMDMDDKQSLQRASCQVYGLIMDTFNSKSLATTLVPRLAHLLEDNKTPAMEAEDDEMEVDMPWEVAYYSLSTLSKIGKSFPELMYALAIWDGVKEMLLHPHAWIRASAARLFGHYFANVNPEDRSHADVRCEFLTRENMSDLVLKFIEQLRSQYLTQDQANQIVRNLFFISKCMYYLPADEDARQDEEQEEDAAVEEQSNTAQAKLDQRASRNAHYWMFRRLTFTARGSLQNKTGGKNILMRSSIFKCFAAIASHMQEDELAPYLVSMITPIYRVTSDEQIKDDKEFGKGTKKLGLYCVHEVACN